MNVNLETPIYLDIPDKYLFNHLTGDPTMAKPPLQVYEESRDRLEFLLTKSILTLTRTELIEAERLLDVAAPLAKDHDPLNEDKYIRGTESFGFLPRYNYYIDDGTAADGPFVSIFNEETKMRRDIEVIQRAAGQLPTD